MFYKTRNDAEIETLDPVFQVVAKEAMQEAEEAGLDILITEGYRTRERSDQLHEDPLVYAVAGGWSMHNFRVAFDCVPVRSDGSVNYGDTDMYRKFAAICKKHGMDWGGDWKQRDLPHFEYTQGHDIYYFRKGGELSPLEVPVKRPLWLSWYPSIPQQIATTRKALARKQSPERKRMLERKLDRLLKRL